LCIGLVRNSKDMGGENNHAGRMDRIDRKVWIESTCNCVWMIQYIKWPELGQSGIIACLPSYDLEFNSLYCVFVYLRTT